MQPTTDANLAGQNVGQRIGFWLGLALFVTLLVMPTPESMRRTARETCAKAIEANTARLLAHRGQREAAPGSPAYQQAFDQAVEDRARTMLAAAAVTALVACWWISVAMPIPVTSLLPLVLFPLVGVLPIREAAVPYADPNVFLFLGGFIIALGLERWNLHRRIALHIVRLVGGSEARIVFGFMLATTVISMWISNTATTMMMLPIGLAIISAVVELAGGGNRDTGEFSAALMMGIAYAASIGGMGTPIGTPPNIVFQGVFRTLYPDAPEVGFGQWVIMFVPLVATFMFVTWLVLTRVTCRVSRRPLPLAREVVGRDLARLGPTGWPERAMLTVFVLTAVLWMTRSIPIGQADCGWSAMLERWLTPAGRLPNLFRAGYINDATVALAAAALLFAIPAGRNTETGQREFLMNWSTAQRLPWGILLLFGGGFSIAAGFQDSGLSYWCGQVFAGIGITSPLLLVMGTCLLVTFLGEITSNTAATQLMLPILARVANATGVNPLLLMLPATISASCGFMLPVATPPNAIVFGSGHISMGRMVRTGLILDFIGVVLVTAAFYAVAVPVLHIDLSALPEWAR